MYRTFSIIVIIFSLFGGGYAGFELYKNMFAVENPADVDQAKGFAAAFARSFLTIEDGTPSSIQVYTDLLDQRNIENEQNIETEGTELLNQKVLGIWPGKTEVLAGKHMNVQLTALIQREVPSADASTKEKNRFITYQLDVPVTQGDEGFKVLQYPKLAKIEKDSTAVLPTLGTTDSQAEIALKPMIMSFFKTFYEAENKEDIANFFYDTANVPSPQKGLFLFDQIGAIKAYPSAENQWFVLIDIQAKDSFTKVSYPFSYTVNVVKEGDKYYIQSINE